jgi:uncharacterized membrane protein YgcG
MFGDRLTLDQCRRLMTQLATTRFPFQCAHGRPTMVPLLEVHAHVQLRDAVAAGVGGDVDVDARSDSTCLGTCHDHAHTTQPASGDGGGGGGSGGGSSGIGGGGGGGSLFEFDPTPAAQSSHWPLVSPVKLHRLRALNFNSADTRSNAA